MEKTINAQISKEGTVTVRLCYTVTFPGIPLDLDESDKEERFATHYEVSGVILSDTGKGPFHNMSVHGIGLSYTDKGERPKLLAYSVWTDPDGDKVFGEAAATPQETTWLFIGGSGKFAGIEGSWELIEPSLGIELKPSKQNTIPAARHVKIRWKLSETKE